MGLFGSSGNPQAEQIAGRARGESLTSDRLTATSRLGMGLLADRPLIELLENDEQPHHYFFNASKGVSRNGDVVGDAMSESYSTACVVTDRRTIFITKGRNGQGVPHADVSSVKTSHGRMKHRLTLRTTDAEYSMYVNRSTDTDELDTAAEYIRDRSRDDDNGARGSSSITGVTPIWRSAVVDLEDVLDADPQGAYVTAERVSNILDCLSEGERVHYLMKGSTVRTEGSASGDNAFGVDPSKTGSAWGNVWIAVTDHRIAVKIERTTKDDGERSIEFSQIIGVDRDSTHTGCRLAVHVPSRTYHLGVMEPDGNEVRDIVEFLRNNAGEPNDEDRLEEPGVAERLRELQDLHNEGLLTDEEFEAKRKELVDDL